MKGKFKFWCYDKSGLTDAYPNSVEVEVIASGEEQAIKTVKMYLRRDMYRLLSVTIL